MNAIKGGVIPGGFIPAVEKGVREAMRAGHGRRLSDPGREGHALRRAAPLGRLVGDGVQDGRLDGVQGRHGEGPADADGADHDRDGRGARGVRGRRDRRPQLAPRAAARHGAEGRRDRDQGRGADGRDARLRPGPARHHRRPGRVHDGPRPVRGGARATWRNRSCNRLSRRRRPSRPDLSWGP